MAKRKPVRIGVLGLGRAGWNMQIKTLRDRTDYEIVAVCDIEQDRVDRAVEEFGCVGYTDYKKMVKDADVQLVTVATRSKDHVKHAIAALKAGKDVLVEKPLGVNLKSVDKLLAAAKKAKGQLVVRHNRRFDADFVHIKEIVDSGKLGEVIRIKLYRQNFGRRNDWQTLREFGGGQLRNWGPHLIDHARMFIGGPIKRVFSNLHLVAAAGDAEDDLKVILEGKNGMLVDIEITGGDAIGGEHTYKVVGTKGGLVASRNEIKLKYLPRKPRAIKASPATPDPEGGFGNKEELVWKEETLEVAPKRKPKDFWEHVYQTVANGKPFPVSLDDSREVVRLIDEITKGTGFSRG